ncbi:MAG: ABC transporter permease [Candidatus Eremiobacteraeota bacterium]|nr:ABC transporter permease [Candidatus Eremiobacteraeota bacterium]
MRKAFGAPLTALAIVVAGGAVAMWLSGVNPLDGFAALVAGSLGGTGELSETLVQTGALLFPALAVALAFRGGLFNIGAEGQLLVGGLAAGAIGATYGGLPVFGILAMLCASALAGGMWGALAGVLRAKFEASEIITTLMLNSIAFYVASYFVGGPLHSPLASGAETAPLPANLWLPLLVPGTRLSIALLLALALAAALQFLLARTVFGFDLRAAGDAPEPARRNGVDLPRITIVALALSGAIAGLGGGTLVTGALHRFNTALSPGYGYTAIAVALVADLNPLWICAAAFGFGMLESGGLAMQAQAQVPKDVIHAIEGVIVLVLAARRFVATRVEQRV